MSRAITFWEAGDQQTAALRQLGERLHAQITRQRGTSTEASAGDVATRNEIACIDAALMPIEEGFSASLDNASR